MTSSRGGAALLGAALLTGSMVAGPANATTNGPTGTASATASCQQRVGDIGKNGWVAGFTVNAIPPTRTAGTEVGRVYPQGFVRLSGSFSSVPTVNQTVENDGYLVLDATMYHSRWTLGSDGKFVPDSLRLSPVGGGWDYNAFVNSEYAVPGSTKVRLTHYGLRRDGTLFRWTIQNGVWKPDRKGATGFAAVKTMALISQTATYDTFLAIARGGALYTIRVPLTSPLKPVVKKVRASTWQGFEQLVATRCGKAGTLLLAIDNDLQVAYLYAIGHANGPSTVIQGLGKVTGGAFDGWSVYHRTTSDPGVEPPLYGE